MLSLGRRRRPRGQSLVEFALLLPILMTMFLGALDFGRVYLGYINLQNMSRIAASYAAANPDGWGSPGDATIQAKYQKLTLADASALNCDLPMSGIPAPTFSGKDPGDSVTVTLNCNFHLILPVNDLFPGGTLKVTSTAVFPVRTGMVASAASSTGPCTVPNPSFSTYDTTGLPKTSFNVGQEVDFSDESGGVPTMWNWDFGDPSSASNTSALQDPAHTYTSPGEYTITLKVGNDCGWNATGYQKTVYVGPPPDWNFSWTPASPVAPADVQFTDTSSGTGTEWQWTFGDGTNSTQQNPAHHFTSAGTYHVTVVIKDATGASHSVTHDVVVAEKLCNVPYFVGLEGVSTAMTVSQAPAAYTAAGFKGMLTSKLHGNPNIDWTIVWQSQVGGQLIPCSTNIEVRNYVK